MSASTPWAAVKLKKNARAAALERGHALCRFRREEDKAFHPPSRRGDYWIAYCLGCNDAVAVSPDRWSTATMGGAALRRDCPTPVVSAELEDDDLEVA